MADARLAQAEALLRGGRAAEAVPLASAVLATVGATPDECKAALQLRAQAREALGDAPAAIVDLELAIGRFPHDARLRNALGILLADKGDVAGSIEALKLAVGLDPAYARGWNNLANALRSSGRVEEAAAAARRAVAAQPDYALGWSNLGAILLDLGDETGASEAFRRSLALRPDVRTLRSLAAIARQRGQVDEAVDLYQRINAAAPGDPATLLSLAGALAERDDVDAARRTYAQARSREPRLLRAAFGERLTLPMVYADACAVEAERARYAEGLSRLEEELPAMMAGRTFADAVDDLRWTNFLLAYQGDDDRELQARVAALMARAVDSVAPEWREAPRRSVGGKRLRVGFASSFFADGTCGRYFRSWIAGLDRTRFEIFVYHLRRDATPFLAELAPRVDRVRRFPGTALVPSSIAAVIRGDALDALVYPELGMHPSTFALAALRLAPVQCAGWGHPVTTGHTTLEAYFTCSAMEPPGASAHYTERLVPLPGIGTDYARPAMPDGASRARYGLPDNVPLLLCPQSLFKIHPDNDALFARVLASATAARLVVFEGRHPALTAKYRARLAAAFAREGVRADQRVIVLPQCGHDDYLRINALCDAMLDTLRWSGGNTSLDALAAGLPVVTLPGRFMRGRQSAAMLTLAGATELIARDEGDYVRIAAQLANERDFRVAKALGVRDGAAAVFGDVAPVRAFADALERLVEALD